MKASHEFGDRYAYLLTVYTQRSRSASENETASSFDTISSEIQLAVFDEPKKKTIFAPFNEMLHQFGCRFSVKNIIFAYFVCISLALSLRVCV